MRIIGIDPGTVCCGYGIVDHHAPKRGGGQMRYVTAGDIKMSRKDELPVRLKQLHEGLRKVLKLHKPSHLCIEKIFYHKSIRTAFTLGSTRGIALLLAAEHTIPVIEYNPTEIKMALTGYGRAEKGQVQAMVRRVLHLDNDHELSEDSSDALALCICHVHTAGSVSSRV